VLVGLVVGVSPPLRSRLPRGAGEKILLYRAMARVVSSTPFGFESPLRGGGGPKGLMLLERYRTSQARGVATPGRPRRATLLAVLRPYAPRLSSGGSCFD
jgi:hypothetical protein